VPDVQFWFGLVGFMYRFFGWLVGGKLVELRGWGQGCLVGWLVGWLID
jgi:hypothetical protein